MSEERLSVSIRMTRDLTRRLKEAADARSHSMNAEIVQRLEETLRFASPSGHVNNLPDSLSDDECILLQAWRAITDEDRAALRVLLRNARIASRAA